MPRRRGELDGQHEMFPDGDFGTPTLRYKFLNGHVWTQNKAQLIARYLREFVFVTKHGTYVDLFAGRQNDDVEASWSVQEVLRQQPTSFKLRHYRLFDLDPAKTHLLRRLAGEYPQLDITVTDAGDSNVLVRSELPVGSLRDAEATFCLLDQRSTECRWDTVKYLAALKTGGCKPELFYFLAQGWLDRTLASRTRDGALQATHDWWGSPDWPRLRDLSPTDRARELADRFCHELGYTHATPWPIYDRRGGSRIMFHMIHATDHDRAPSLMRRAYDWAVEPVRNPNDEEQLSLELSRLSL